MNMSIGSINVSGNGIGIQNNLSNSVVEQGQPVSKKSEKEGQPSNLVDFEVKEVHVPRLRNIIGKDIDTNDWEIIMADIFMNNNVSYQNIKSQKKGLANVIHETILEWIHISKKENRNFSNFLGYFGDNNTRLKETLTTKSKELSEMD